MGIIVFTDNPTVPETQLVLEEARDRGETTQFVAPWDISMPHIPGTEADLVYVPSNMLNRGSTFELVHRFLILKEFEQRIGSVINPVDSMLRYSKEHLTLQISKLEIPHPRTLATENVVQAYEFASSLLDSGREVVLKPLCRGRGFGVTLLSDIRSREDLLQFLFWYSRAHAQGVFYLQEFIPNQGYDIRCFVLDEKVIGREKRSNPEDFRYNVSVGGIAEAFDESLYDELAIKVAESVGLKIAGIDVLLGADGVPYVLEANCFPGFTALIEATGIPIHKMIVDYLQQLMKA
jgi:RimK family alpha-L-glutamate ligase